MATVELIEEDLFAHRPRDIGGMLAELQGRQVACQASVGLVSGGRIFAAHSGRTNPKSHYSQWRFRTVSRDIECQYYELWKPSGQSRVMFLDRAYLHVYRIDRAERRARQLVCIHTDPYAISSTVTSPYKQGLHLHVTEASDPIPKCHFPIILSHSDHHLDELLSSSQNLTTAFGRAATMIRYELVERFR
jgi:hypothetical protein